MQTYFYFLSRWQTFVMAIIGDCYHQNYKILVLPYSTMAKVQNCISFNICKWTPVSKGNPDGSLAWNTIIVPYGDLKDCLGVRKSCQTPKGSCMPIVVISLWENHSPKVQVLVSNSPEGFRPLPREHVQLLLQRNIIFFLLRTEVMGSPWLNSFNSRGLFCCSKRSQYF